MPPDSLFAVGQNAGSSIIAWCTKGPLKAIIDPLRLRIAYCSFYLAAHIRIVICDIADSWFKLSGNPRAEINHKRWIMIHSRAASSGERSKLFRCSSNRPSEIPKSLTDEYSRMPCVFF